jgi:hypothetical protein
VSNLWGCRPIVVAQLELCVQNRPTNCHGVMAPPITLPTTCRLGWPSKTGITWAKLTWHGMLWPDAPHTQRLKPNCHCCWTKNIYTYIIRTWIYTHTVCAIVENWQLYKYDAIICNIHVLTTLHSQASPVYFPGQLSHNATSCFFAFGSERYVPGLS